MGEPPTNAVKWSENITVEPTLQQDQYVNKLNYNSRTRYAKTPVAVMIDLGTYSGSSGGGNPKKILQQNISAQHFF